MVNFDVTQALDIIYQKPLERLPQLIFHFDGSTTLADNTPLFTVSSSEILPENSSSKSTPIPPTVIDVRINEVNKETSLTDTYKLPDISFTEKILETQTFSLFNDVHKEIAGRLIEILLNAPNERSFIEIASKIRDKINCRLFYYTLSVAVLHRKDTQNYSIPSVIEQFPINFIEPSILNDARAEAFIHGKNGNMIPIDIPRNFTASEREEEQRLAYFREDIGINAHYWHWHIIYPSDGPLNIIKKDRRGELFYYIHQQIMSRYNAERFCNSLAKTKPFNIFNNILSIDYFPKILNCLNNRTYSSRSKGIQLRNLERRNNTFDISNLQRWTDRIHLAIDQKFVIAENGEHIPLDEINGIDILGNIIESSALSINRQLYGNLHNAGHNVIACAHDPDERYLEDIGIIGDIATAMRDPIFYSWHAFIDSLFQKFKASLPSYKDYEVNFDGIEIENLEIKLKNPKEYNNPLNLIKTFLKKSDINIAAGLDYAYVDNLYGRYTHLQHETFLYKILINNQSDTIRLGTCRIFISPKADERHLPLDFDEQRLLMIELDKFIVTLYPGKNGIVRSSEDSNVAIPFNNSLRNRSQGSQFCGCGWPQYMLIPRGNENGMLFDIFVMISDYTDDIVNQTETGADICDESSSYCGLKDKLYPDKRAMGYPFDRHSEVNTLEKFVEKYSNMKVTEVTIQFKNEIISNKNI